jgi:hypothetical protein
VDLETTRPGGLVCRLKIAAGQRGFRLVGGGLA